MTIWERVKAALTSLSLPMAASVYIPPGQSDFPAAYLVYFVVDAQPEQHADNAEQNRSHLVQVSYFSRAGLDTMPGIDAAMTAAGFDAGPSRELPFSWQTRHYGFAMDFTYLEDKEQP